MTSFDNWPDLLKKRRRYLISSKLMARVADAVRKRGNEAIGGVVNDWFRTGSPQEPLEDDQRIARYLPTLKVVDPNRSQQHAQETAAVLSDALIFVHGRNFDRAEELLLEVISRTPRGWQAVETTDRSKSIAFWSPEEFMLYTGYSQGSSVDSGKMIIWTKPSYSRAWFLLAQIAAERDDPYLALHCIEFGLELEPDNPLLLCEKGFVKLKLKEHKQAYESYSDALNKRLWSPPSQKALALRGMGISVIDLGRLDEAEELLKKSLEFEPDSPVAAHEIEYISQLRSLSRRSGPDQTASEQNYVS